MAYSTKWFTDIRNLKSISRPNWIALLKKYKDSLVAKNIKIPDPPVAAGKQDESDEEFYKALAAIFFHPEGLPGDLHEALYYVREMDSDPGHGQIIQAVMADVLHLDLTLSLPRADYAVLAWLDDEDVLKSLHENVGMEKAKTYIYFETRSKALPVMKPFAAAKPLMEKALDQTFDTRSRGRGTHLFHKEEGSGAVVPYRSWGTLSTRGLPQRG